MTGNILQYQNVTLFYDTEFKNPQQYINFGDNTTRDNVFDNTSAFTKTTFSSDFNFVRDRLEINVPLGFSETLGINYMMTVNTETNEHEFFFVTAKKYIMTDTTKLAVFPHVLMTYCQGDIAQTLSNSYVDIERQHLTNALYYKNLKMLLNNDDVLTTATAQIDLQNRELLADTTNLSSVNLIILSSAELNPAKTSNPAQPFGDGSAPVLPVPNQLIIEGVASPIGAYVISYAQYTQLNKFLSNLPWIAQCITRVIAVPVELLDMTQMTSFTISYGGGNVELFEFNDGYVYNPALVFKNLNMTWEQMLKLNNVQFSSQDLHLNREPYVKYLANTYSQVGNLEINPAFLPLPPDLNSLDDAFSGMLWNNLNISGYANQFSVFLQDYQSNNENGGTTVGNRINGEFLNHSLSFNVFDDVPVLIDNYKLQWDKESYQRRQDLSHTLTGGVATLFDPKANLTDKLAGVGTALGFVGDLATQGLSALAKQARSDIDTYQNQQTQQKTMSLTPSTVTNMTTANSFNMINEIYGITLKRYAVPEFDMEKVLMYHKKTGFKWNILTLLEKRSMSLLNFYQFTGAYAFPNVPSDLLTIIQTHFEVGVSCFWYKDNSGNVNMNDLRYSHVNIYNNVREV